MEILPYQIAVGFMPSLPFGHDDQSGLFQGAKPLRSGVGP